MGSPEWPDELSGQRARLCEVFEHIGYQKVLGARLADWGLGWATVTITPGTEAVNLAGTVHGGVIASLADLAFEVACNSYGRLAVAAELAVHYAAAAVPGVPLRAEAVEVTRSRRLASYRIDVVNEVERVAWAQAVAYRTNRWHGAEEDYPAEWRERF
jgi:acyl-CoA thioesterase